MASLNDGELVAYVLVRVSEKLKVVNDDDGVRVSFELVDPVVSKIPISRELGDEIWNNDGVISQEKDADEVTVTDGTTSLQLTKREAEMIAGHLRRTTPEAGNFA